VLMVYMRYVSSAVKNPELQGIVIVAVIDVGRVIGIISSRCLSQPSKRIRGWRRRERVAGVSASRKGGHGRSHISKLCRGTQLRVCRHERRWRYGRRWRHCVCISRSIHQHRRIAHRPRAQKEFFKLTIDAIAHRAHTNPVSVNFCPDSTGAIVDGEGILAGLSHGKRVLLFLCRTGRWISQNRKRLTDNRTQCPVIDNCKFSIWLLPVRRGWVLAEERINARRRNRSSSIAIRLRIINSGGTWEPSHVRASDHGG